MQPQTQRLVDVFCESLQPPPILTVSEWADQFARLSPESSAKPGRWVTIRYQKDPMDCLSPSHPCEKVVLKCASQVMKTAVLLNFLGFIISADPGPVLFVEPREADAEALSKDRIKPMLRDTPILRGKVADAKSRSADNTTLHKVFRGGQVTLVGANSPSGLAMRPIRYAILDEVSRYAKSAGKEGDPVKLAIRRTDTFDVNRKIALASSPGIEGQCRIDQEYQQSDQREFFVPCPFCGEAQVLQFPRLEWPEGEPDQAQYRCVACEELIPHYKKAWMVEHGEYRAQNPTSAVPGFHLSQMYALHRTWGQIACEFIESKGNPESLKTFINTVLAETWQEKGDVPDWRRLYDHREEYVIGVVPEGGLLLTAGVDVQADRLEVELVAWGRNRESWSVAYFVLRGATDQADVWQQLHDVLAQDWPHASGGTMPIFALGLDTGYRPKEAYAFAARQSQALHTPAGLQVSVPRTVIPLKGGHGWDKVIEGVSNADAARKRGGVRIVTLGVNVLKREFMDRLRLDPPTDEALAAGASYPAGYCHTPHYEAAFYQGWTAESLIASSRRKPEYVKAHNARNEPLDCRIYARAAGYLCGIDVFREEHWTRFAERLARTIAPSIVHEAPAAVAAARPSRAVLSDDPFLS